jgi:2-isopropylmalate synthase
VGVHLHNDTDCGVANALAGVRAGAVHVQGTINGYGERVGNCNLVSIIPNLTLKMGFENIAAGRLGGLTSVAHHVAELVNFTVNPQQPYVGRRRSRTRRVCTRVRSRGARTRTSTSIPRSSATARGSW